MIEALVLGSGHSDGVPIIHCLAATDDSCCAASSGVASGTPEGLLNKRRNDEAVVRLTDAHGEQRTVLIDVGQAFTEAANELFPKHALRQIDAVLLTHIHDDATIGIGQLRLWTAQQVLQDTMHVYCTRDVEDELRRMRPWLFSTAQATGSRVVGDITFHAIEPDVNCDLFGTQVTPVQVQHGTARDGSPYPALGFLFGRSLSSISPTLVPETAYAVLARAFGDQAYLPLLLIASLRLQPHPSHYSFAQACALVARLNARRTYLLSLADGPSHAQWTALGDQLRRLSPPTMNDLVEPQSWQDYAPAGIDKPRLLWRSVHTLAGVAPDDADGFIRFALAERGVSCARGQDLRPAFDGLALRVDDEGGVQEIERFS